MRRLGDRVIIAMWVSCLLVASAGAAGTASATPRQAAQIKQLQAQVKRQQAAINKRNETIDELTADRDIAQAALVASAAQQISIMTGPGIWSLLASARARLAAIPSYGVTFDNSNFGTFGSQTYLFTWTWGI